jgi:hypothetical protein
MCMAMCAGRRGGHCALLHGGTWHAGAGPQPVPPPRRGARHHRKRGVGLPLFTPIFFSSSPSFPPFHSVSPLPFPSPHLPPSPSFAPLSPPLPSSPSRERAGRQHEAGTCRRSEAGGAGGERLSRRLDVRSRGGEECGPVGCQTRGKVLAYTEEGARHSNRGHVRGGKVTSVGRGAAGGQLGSHHGVHRPAMSQAPPRTPLSHLLLPKRRTAACHVITGLFLSDVALVPSDVLFT